MIPAAGADELKQAGIAAFETAVHDAGRLAPHKRRPAMARLTGQRECHAVFKLAAQPRVTAIVRGGDGGRRDSGSGTGHGVRADHSTHRQAVGSALPQPAADGSSGAAGVWSSLSATADHNTHVLRRTYPAGLESAWLPTVKAMFPSRLPRRHEPGTRSVLLDLLRQEHAQQDGEIGLPTASMRGWKCECPPPNPA